MDGPQEKESEPIGAFEVDGADIALLMSSMWSTVVPNEICLFKPGITATKKGNFLFDEEAAESVLSSFLDDGMDRLPFDAAHGMLIKGGAVDQHKALGWFVPVVKEDIENGGGLALFASDIQWTDAGIDALKAREFRFFSPAITFNSDTCRVTKLINVALTNIPATKNQRPLVLDASEAEQTNNDEESMKVLLDTLGASDETGAVAKVSDLQTFQSAILSALDCSESDAAEKIASLSTIAIEATAQLETLKTERAAEAKTAKLDALTKDGKLPPAQREFAEALSSEQLDSFVATLSSVVPSQIQEPAGSGTVETLSADEKAACRALNISEDQFLEEKKGAE